MINLLPENEKKSIDREYVFRRYAVLLSSVLVLIVVSGVVLVPSYVLALYKSKSTQQISKADVTAASDQAQFKKELDRAKFLLKVLRPDAVAMYPSDIIALLIKDKTDQNTINGIQYVQNETGAIIASVNGIAKTRESLSVFTRALSHEPGIANVDVPVSNFAKDADIPFSFTLSVATSTPQ